MSGEFVPKNRNPKNFKCSSRILNSFVHFIILFGYPVYEEWKKYIWWTSKIQCPFSIHSIPCMYVFRWFSFRLLCFFFLRYFFIFVENRAHCSLGSVCIFLGSDKLVNVVIINYQASATSSSNIIASRARCGQKMQLLLLLFRVKMV